MGFKQYIIKEGRHRSGIHLAPHIDCTFIHKQVLFETDCQYNLGTVDQFDINKLFGLTFGQRKIDSARFGWASVGDKIEIFAYCYVNGVRTWKSMGLVSLNTMYNFKLFVQDDRYLFKVYHADKLVSTTFIEKTHHKCIGYYLFPYFGGNMPAPHRMHIQVRNLKGKSFKVFN